VGQYHREEILNKGKNKQANNLCFFFPDEKKGVYSTRE
jgi:hypothetical protein